MMRSQNQIITPNTKIVHLTKLKEYSGVFQTKDARPATQPRPWKNSLRKAFSPRKASPSRPTEIDKTDGAKLT